MNNVPDLDSKSSKGFMKYLKFRKIEPKTINKTIQKCSKISYNIFYERNGVELTTYYIQSSKYRFKSSEQMRYSKNF